jgi:hypothetical protein
MKNPFMMPTNHKFAQKDAPEINICKCPIFNEIIENENKKRVAIGGKNNEEALPGSK